MDVKQQVSTWDVILAGAAAWLALNVVVHALAPMLGLSTGIVAGSVGSPFSPAAAGQAQVWIGRAVLFGVALGWSLLFYRIRSEIPGDGWWQGLAFGTGIWLVSALVLPLLGVFALGFAGVQGIVLSVLAHQVFGVTLSMVSGR